MTSNSSKHQNFHQSTPFVKHFKDIKLHPNQTNNFQMQNLAHPKTANKILIFYMTMTSYDEDQTGSTRRYEQLDH